MNFLRNILIFVVPIYWIITKLRNWLYDKNIFRSQSYDHPVICVGNLSVGGTGKTPMIEYLVNLLNEKYQVATLSRGYKRQSVGFVLADHSVTAQTIGDEPYQIHSKFPSILVAVDANRRRGIQRLINLENRPEVILLDDAFQHRKVKAGLNLLLTTFDRLYVNDIVLPTGDLREPRSGAKRADIIIVTKCPKNLSESDKEKIQKRLNMTGNQTLFFSSIHYVEGLRQGDGQLTTLEALKTGSFTLVTGIANPKPLIDYLKEKKLDFEQLAFPDHHEFTESEIKLLEGKGRILTTEKDYMRLKDRLDPSKLYYLPIETQISNSEAFNQMILDFMTR